MKLQDFYVILILKDPLERENLTWEEEKRKSLLKENAQVTL